MSIFIILLFAAVPARAAGGGGSLPDVLIQAEEKREVTSDKPPLDIELKEEAPLESVLKTEEELRKRIPYEVIESTKFVTELFTSPYTAVPASNWIVMAWKGESAHVFFPAEELAKVYKERDRKREKKKKGKDEEAVEVGWDWVVVDAAGRVFRKFSGEDMPPERLEWDGKGDDGSWLRVGQVYTGVLTYRDPSGRSHTAMGRPFSLAGLSVKHPAGYVIQLAPKAVFGGAERRGDVTPQGEKLLREAAQLIQRHHPGLSLEVAAHLSWSDQRAVEKAASGCAERLAKRLLMPEGSVGRTAQPDTPDLEERLEVDILNR